MFVIHYQLIGERTKERTAELMAVFGERGAAPGTVAHYVYADGGGGMVIGDNLDRLYEDALEYSPWMELDARPIISIEDAVPAIAGWMSS